MGYQTKEEIMEKWTSTREAKDEEQEIKSIRADVAAARAILADGLARYKKKKLKARSIKKVADGNPFSELEDYNTRQQIQDAYGWELITEARMDYLMNLWDLREESKFKANDGQYHDRVTDMIEDAMCSLGEDLMERVYDFDERRRKMEREAEKLAIENNERTFRREHGEIV